VSFVESDIAEPGRLIPNIRNNFGEEMNSEEKEMVDTLFDKYLEDGKAVIFTRGENSPFNFQMIKKVRKLLLETEIEFKEIDISKHQNEHFI